jgi:hypothetical protein
MGFDWARSTNASTTSLDNERVWDMLCFGVVADG